MLKSVFLKTLYEKRWTILGWNLAIILLDIFIAVVFPVMRDSFGETLKNVPESMKTLIGSAADYQTYIGYTDIQVVEQMATVVIILGVMIGSAFIAGDEGEGTLQTLLYQPLRRGSVFFQKLLASMVIVMSCAVSTSAGIYLGALFIGETNGLYLDKLAAVAVTTWLLTMVFATMAYAIGAMTGKRGIAGAVAGLTAFVTFMVTSLAATADILKTLNHFSPFYYFNDPSALRQGLDLENSLILLGISLVFVAVGYVSFVKRDIYQR